MLKDWREDDPATYLEQSLSKQTGNLRWPGDEEFEASFVNDPQYGRKSANWVLWRLEENHGHKEGLRADDIQIEHILPQTPSADWTESLPDDDKKTIERWIDTYGNLTLTGYNGELGNRGFESKRLIYSQSHFEINKSLAGEPSWNVASIKRRGESLAQIAKNIWSGPSLSAASQGVAK